MKIYKKTKVHNALWVMEMKCPKCGKLSTSASASEKELLPEWSCFKCDCEGDKPEDGFFTLA